MKNSSPAVGVPGSKGGGEGVLQLGILHGLPVLDAQSALHLSGITVLFQFSNNSNNSSTAIEHVFCQAFVASALHILSP